MDLLSRCMNKKRHPALPQVEDYRNVDSLTVKKEHICVCICTYQRAEYLHRCLKNLLKQKTRGIFDYSILIVDNDRFESAKCTAESFYKNKKIAIRYYVQPEQNIALARNTAVEHSEGDFIGLIDDDEFPTRNWLLSLYISIKKYNSAGILGPVLPHFDNKPPKWVLEGAFFDRPTHPTGHVLEWNNTRTGNALIRRDIFPKNQVWFDPMLGSGGEDRDFFRRKIKEGNVFIWSNDAQVFETIPPTRWKRKVLIKRAFLRGKMSLNDKGSESAGILKSVVAIVAYSIWLPFLFVVSHHIFMKYLIKNCDHLGKVLTFLGIELVKEKYVRG
jgi:glycosyltransferase involved in cell wall biosynthesis